MECPKCQGASYLAEEEFIQVLDAIEPVKVVTKGTYMCKSCTDKFTRIHVDTLEGKRKPSLEDQPAATQPVQKYARNHEVPETLKFF